LPVAANAATGESPRISLFGLIGDTDAFSEGAAYGTDQSAPIYSPYSVYGETQAGGNAAALYDPSSQQYADNKKAILKETQTRVSRIPKYIEKKQWFNVEDEMVRYMYETRAAIRTLAKTREQKQLATTFFKAMEETDLYSKRHDQEKCSAAYAKMSDALDSFAASV